MGTPNVVGDAVLVQSTTTGTGTYQLGPALDGHFSLATAGIPSGSRVSYTVVDSLTAPTLREVVEGIYTAGSPSTLTRASIKRSSTGAAINWGVGTRYIFLTPNAGNLPLLDTDGRLPPNLLPTLVDNMATGLFGAWTFYDVDPGASEVQVFSVPVPPRCRIIRGMGRISGRAGAQPASLLPRVYLINAQGQQAFPALAPAARGVANSYPDTSFPVSWDTNPGTVGAGWTMRFNVLRDNPISMLEYNFNGTALIDPP